MSDSIHIYLEDFRIHFYCSVNVRGTHVHKVDHVQVIDKDPLLKAMRVLSVHHICHIILGSKEIEHLLKVVLTVVHGVINFSCMTPVVQRSIFTEQRIVLHEFEQLQNLVVTLSLLFLQDLTIVYYFRLHDFETISLVERDECEVIVFIVVMKLNHKICALSVHNKGSKVFTLFWVQPNIFNYNSVFRY